jgi:hypothetical protein
MKFADGKGNIDILIYIIIMVVGLVANAYRNYTKKKEQENRQPGEIIPDFPEVGFDPLFEYEKPVYKEPVMSEPEPETELTSTLDSQPVMEETVSADEVKSFNIPDTEGQAVFESTARLLVSDNMSDLGVTIAEGESTGLEISKGEIGAEEEVAAEEGFDLERAVINSEILRTKYFSNSY